MGIHSKNQTSNPESEAIWREKVKETYRQKRFEKQLKFYLYPKKGERKNGKNTRNN